MGFAFQQGKMLGEKIVDLFEGIGQLLAFRLDGVDLSFQPVLWIAEQSFEPFWSFVEHRLVEYHSLRDALDHPCFYLEIRRLLYVALSIWASVNR